MELPTATIKNLEAFSTGVWNGDFYDTDDLDGMVFAFKRLKNKWLPFLKAGHESGQEDEQIAEELFGAPSLGFITDVWREGKKLLVNVQDVPRKFADLIKAGAYRRVSAEIFFDYTDESTGKVYSKVLKAIAFLGSQIPAVTSLKEVADLYARQFRSDAVVKTYSFELRNGGRRTLRGVKTMQLNTYQSDEIAALDYAAYGRGDQQAGRRIQREIDSGTSLKDLASLSERYRRGDMAPKSAREASPKEISDAGIALHNDAVERLQARGLQHTPENYRKSFSEAMQGAPSVAATYSRGVKLDNDDDADVHSFYETGDTEMSPVVVISNLVTNIPRPPSNDIDFVTAARAVNEFVPIDIRQLAAEECLQNLSDKSGKSREEIEREHEALADAAESGEFSEEGLRELCWPLFSRDR